MALEPDTGPVADPLLADTADRLAAEHQQHSDFPDQCLHPTCYGTWPCLSARFATHARSAAHLGGQLAWTARLDLAQLAV
ncbi:hypothetical protein [Longispora urticae]